MQAHDDVRVKTAAGMADSGDIKEAVVLIWKGNEIQKGEDTLPNVLIPLAPKFVR